jgi:hypothetical protein
MYILSQPEFLDIHEGMVVAAQCLLDNGIVLPASVVLGLNRVVKLAPTHGQQTIDLLDIDMHNPDKEPAVESGESGD